MNNQKATVSPRPSEVNLRAQPKTRMERILNSMMSKKPQDYQSNEKTPDVYDREYLTRSSTPPPVLAEHNHTDSNQLNVIVREQTKETIHL